MMQLHSYKTLEDVHRRLQKLEDLCNSHWVVNLKPSAVTTESPTDLGEPYRKQGILYRTYHSSMDCTASLSTEPKYRMQHFFHSSYNSGCGNSELFYWVTRGKKSPSWLCQTQILGLTDKEKNHFWSAQNVGFQIIFALNYKS